MRYHCLENKDTDKTENKDSDSPETISKQIHGIFSPKKNGKVYLHDTKE